MSDAIADAAPHRHRLRIDRWQGFPYDSLLRAVRGLTPRTIVYFAYFRRDGHGRTMVPTDVLPEIARQSGAPIYGFADVTLGTGVVGGAMWRHDDEAVQTGRLAARVLRREADVPIPGVERASTAYMADWRVLRRFGLDQNRLPPDTEVLFRVPSLWERHGEVVVAALVLILVESLLIGLLLLERRRRMHAQREVANQMKYEQTIAELMTDAARYASADAPRALEDAIGRIGRYADAEEVALVHCSHSPSQPDICLQWERGDPKGKLGVNAAATRTLSPALECPLAAGGEALGRLTLRRATGVQSWSRASWRG